MGWIVHIGTQKTGSKSLQAALAAGEMGPGTLFPAAGRQGAWHEPIYHELLAGGSARLEAAVRELGGRPGAVGILSCEAFHELPAAAVGRMASILGEVRVVAFLRRQDDFANSFLNQLAKAHRVSEAEIVAFERGLGCPMERLDYASTLARWSEALGPGNVRPVVFDKRADTVARFREAAGLPAGAAVRPARTSNPGLDWFSYVVLRKLKRRVLDPEELPDVVSRAHRLLATRFIDTRSELAVDLLGAGPRAEILDLYRISNLRVRETWFPGQAELFPVEPEFGETRADWSVGDAEVEAILEGVGT